MAKRYAFRLEPLLKLRRRRAAYLVMLNRREQAETDDLNVTRFAHAMDSVAPPRPTLKASSLACPATWYTQS